MKIESTYLANINLLIKITIYIPVTNYKCLNLAKQCMNVNNM